MPSNLKQGKLLSAVYLYEAMKKSYSTSRKQFASRFPDGFDFNVRRVLSVSKLSLPEIMESSKKKEAVMWRRIYMSFLWMNGLNLEQTGKSANKDHATALLAISYVHENMKGVLAYGTKGSIKSREIKQALLDIVMCEDVSFVRSLSVCDDEYIGLLALENQLNEIQTK